MNKKDWIALRIDEEPTEFFSTSVYLSVFRDVTEFQSQFGNRIVMLNTNRIRDETNHDLVKEEMLCLLGNKDSCLEESSFHLVS